ncbi:hypothetical protein KR084_007017 [Drosophila pseudotakahashii]|nr:hypothetical protein KR084_007017 [Drosophila pseudotakahashii]
MSTFVVKLLQRSQLSHSQKDTKPFIYVRSNWMDDEAEFDFLSTTDNTNYRGSLKFEELRTAASDLEQTYDTFFAECKTAMTTTMGLQGFDYALTFEDGDKPFFRMYKCEGYETLYLEVPLRKVSNCYQLLDAAIEASQQKPQADPDPESEKTTSLAEYEKYVKDSKLKEEELLKKFLLLINSKKAYIRDLESQLEERSKKPLKERKNQRVSSEEEDEAYGAATQAMNIDNDSD